jgi:hypothetical protein
LNNFDPIVPGRYKRWIQLVEDAAPQVREELLRQAGVGGVERIDVQQPGGVRFDMLVAAPRFQLFTCPEWFGNGDEVLQRLDVLRSNQPVLFLEGQEGAHGCQAGLEGAVNLLSEKPDQVRLAIDAPDPGWMLAGVPFFPGWEALLDGKPVAILHANYLFMGIEISQGKHELILQYRPKSFYLGAMLSILVLFWILVLLSGGIRNPGLRRQHARILDRQD